MIERAVGNPDNVPTFPDMLGPIIGVAGQVFYKSYIPDKDDIAIARLSGLRAAPENREASARAAIKTISARQH